MNSLFVLIVAILWFLFAYRWYGKRTIERNLSEPLDTTSTPAVAKNDGIDYCPTHPLVLFGHHFSSIAGAGPIVGPIIAAAAFGWGPALLWPLLGGVFIGAVHDYLSLMLSVRHGGTSIPDIADRYVSRRSRLFFLIFVQLALIFVVAVFSALTAKTFISTPQIVLPTFGVIPLAMLFGLSQHRWPVGPLWLRTIMAFGILVLLIYLGYLFPLSLPLKEDIAYITWLILLMIYAYFASTLPVWILLQPRDYLSSWVLIVGVALAIIGVVVSHPWLEISGVNSTVDQIPLFIQWRDPEIGALVPFLFIVIACGAISGFHAIVAGGTSAKQLAKEKDALFISYGAMLTESLVAVIAVLAAAAALRWHGNGGVIATMKEAGPVGVFGKGFGSFTSFLFGTQGGTLVGVTMVNIFVITTLDTTVRLGRFLAAETAGETFQILQKNRYLATLVPIIPAFLLGITGAWKTIWPLFGSANQLVGALTLIVITAYLYSRGKPVRYTLWATIFMLVMTIGALLFLSFDFFAREDCQYALGITALILIILAILMIKEGVALFVRDRRRTP